jgi:hypothetical protein
MWAAHSKIHLKMGLAVSQSHCAPTEDTDLVVRSADFHRFALGVHSEGVVDVVDTILQPDTAVTAHSLNRLDGFFCALGFDAVVSYLPTALVGDNLTIFQGQATVFSNLFNSSNVNHFVSLLSLCVFIITLKGAFVKPLFYFFQFFLVLVPSTATALLPFTALGLITFGRVPVATLSTTARTKELGATTGGVRHIKSISVRGNTATAHRRT